jgi:membrane carboxypeptidase/penicillin-binding protein PbpC
VGNADNKPMERVSGVTGAGPIWHDFMQVALKGKPIQQFTRPDGLIDLDVCATSGLLPTPYCPYSKREVFIAGTQPTRPDNLYQPIKIDVATGLPATADTPHDRVETRVYLMLPAEAREWARDNGILQLTTTNDVSRTASLQLPTSNFQVRITRPDNGTIYRITPQTPIETQRIPVQALVADNVRWQTMTINVDGQSIGEFTSSPARTWWTLRPGSHTIAARVIDEQGQSLDSEAITVLVTQ